MPMYVIEFSYKLPEWGSVTLFAEDPEQAEEFAREEIMETYEDIVDMSIDGVKELENA